MYLSIDQIRIVERDVRHEGVSYSHLGYDLVDHVCCDIEDRMSMGISFDDAYTEVQQDIGVSGLRRVQQETLLLIDKNYRMMKKSMKTLGTIALAMMAIAALAKIQHWPGASVLLTLSIFVVSTIFFPAALYVWYKEVFNKENAFVVVLAFLGGFTFMVGTLFKIQHWPGANLLLATGGLAIVLTILIGGIRQIFARNGETENKGLYLFGIFSGIVFILGSLFKIQHWPGAAALIMFGSVLLFTVFIPIYMFRILKDGKLDSRVFLFAVYALTYILVFTFLLALNVSNKSMHGFAYIDTEMKSVVRVLEMQKGDLSEMDDQLYELNQTAKDLCNHIDNLKVELIAMVDKVDLQRAKEINDDLTLLNSNGFEDKVYKFMQGSNYDGEGFKLYNEIEQYYSLIEKVSNNSYSNEFVDNTFGLPEKGAEKWIGINFHKVPTITALNNLTQLQLDVQLVLREVLTNVDTKLDERTESES